MPKQEDSVMKKDEWLLCPVCKCKTRTRIRRDTTLLNFPLFCPKCKHDTLVNVEQLNTIIIKEPDAEPIIYGIFHDYRLILFIYKNLRKQSDYFSASFDSDIHFAITVTTHAQQLKNK